MSKYTPLTDDFLDHYFDHLPEDERMTRVMQIIEDSQKPMVYAERLDPTVMWEIGQSPAILDSVIDNCLRDAEMCVYNHIADHLAAFRYRNKHRDEYLARVRERLA